MGWKINKKDDSIGEFFTKMKPHWSRFVKDLWPWRWLELQHSAVNLPVEAARLSPYQFGHIVFFIVLFLAIGLVISMLN